MNWKEYENIVYEECLRIYPHANVERDVQIVGRITGALRQIDVLVTTDDCRIVYDAKFYRKHIDVKLVESMIGMCADISVDKLVIVTERGYSNTALKRAHFGTECIEADILSIDDLQQYQIECSIVYSGVCGVLLKAPFGWVIDFCHQQHNQFVAVLYKRGCRNLNDAGSEQEWGYYQFWDKQKNSMNTIQKLLSYHRDEYESIDAKGQLQILIDEKDVKITSFYSSTYPTKEYIGYRDFSKFIFFFVMFCPDEVAKRDIDKLYKMLKDLLPLNIVQKRNGKKTK